MALRKHNLPSGRLKNDFDEVDEAMFQSIDWPRLFIFSISGIEKSDFHEIA
jgi:hypothetical protein